MYSQKKKETKKKKKQKKKSECSYLKSRTQGLPQTPMSSSDRFARISLQLHGEENIGLNLVKRDSSASLRPMHKVYKLITIFSSRYRSTNCTYISGSANVFYCFAISRCLFEFGNYNYRGMEMRAHI